MKIKKQKYPKFHTRTKTKFLLLPKKIRQETRWLEKATWKEMYNWHTKFEPPLYEEGWRWEAFKWID